MTKPIIVIWHDYDDDNLIVYAIDVASETIATEILLWYSRYLIEFMENFDLGGDYLEVPAWIMQFCGCNCVEIPSMYFQHSQEMFD